MANILLIEPDYKCKYPPLGLMKIAYYHKELKKDFVWFTKGRLPYKISNIVKEKIENSKYYQTKFKDENINTETFIDNVNDIIEGNKWDRVYVSSLFTYEYEKTKEAINYAKEITNRDLNKIIFGGISATLLTEKYEVETGIKAVTGQLVSSEMIGYDDSINIDILTPDYSILENIDYDYQNSDAYYAYSTRGCGMKCGFCAVQKLEPQYSPYISIKNQIWEINERYGERKDLLLMDNNVLKSPKLNQIIEDIIDLGFAKGAQCLNSKSGKKSRNRYVDFNQGLDAKLFTEEKVKLLSKIAIRPARIAFDHIEDYKEYEKAIRLAAQYDITHLSNYLLYNAESFSGKGSSYKADIPADLYNRLDINVKLQEELNLKREQENKERIHIFSFPMRYIPLEDIERGFSASGWNIKYLRAIQAILIPTQGKGVSSKSFFKAAFGENVEVFKEILIMPENYIASRGNPDKIKGIEENEREERWKSFQHWEELRSEWKKLYDGLDDKEKEYFINKIGNNEYTYKTFKGLTEEKFRNLYIHYLTENALLLEIFHNLYMDDDDKMIEDTKMYLLNEGKEIYASLVKYVAETNTMNKQREIYFKIFQQKGLIDVISYWALNNKGINDTAFKVTIQYKKYLGNDLYNINKLLWIIKEQIKIKEKELIEISNKLLSFQISSFEEMLNKKMDIVYKMQVTKVKNNKLTKEECLKIFSKIHKDTMYKPN
ncbi:hypothetical protein [Clostridium sp. DJ247]|uniref:hypothetical protein n=1 Tax=Clostridium sp. DJ247 TaxID=2726188 RepID=UPI0016233510|nr:hypothetical protein [Clostridium sp. DJ247]MBC2579167.1 hypothetical protein [Clostridium sp. DJ247]